MAFMHEGDLPAVGAIERILDSKFAESPKMKHPVLVRAALNDVLPVDGELTPLTLDTYFWAWKLAWAEAVSRSDATQLHFATKHVQSESA